ncbi:hypothetical protein [Streptomyces sp. WAC00469]|uniref:hypothetical protein n=1 Tax=Streptomyces sp. WAC00469 TaxID=2487415 RepID=UPI000F741B10|nr:hypothetical protein [Streptomyces sp. WAC00469]RSR97950.1 hypothetical protein EF917_21185 [Streptomyces sp. WAC00469]
MLALRLTRVARPAVQLRRLTVAAASAGTAFLMLCSLGHALARPAEAAAASLHLSWCVVPLAATVYLAIAVARTDPGTRPRPGLSALGLGPGRLMAVSAATTALVSCCGTVLGLLAFLHLRGDLGGAGLPLSGEAAGVLGAGEPLPVPGTPTLLLVVPALAAGAVAFVLRPREMREPSRGFGRFTARKAHAPAGVPDAAAEGTDTARTADGTGGAVDDRARCAGESVPLSSTVTPDTADRPEAPGEPGGWGGPGGTAPGRGSDLPRPAPQRTSTVGLPWGIAALATGLAVEAWADRAAGSPAASGPAAAALPGGLTADSGPVLIGWLLTALGLALAGPGLTQLCGRLLQSAQPGPVRLLAGRILMAEARRIGRPLGVVCAVASGAFALVTLQGRAAPGIGPLTALGIALVAGCSVATLLIAAVEARQDRAEVRTALRRLGAPATALRSAAALRAGALLAFFAPLTLVIADLAALPLAR